MDKAIETKLFITEAKRVAVINAPPVLGRFERGKDGPIDVLLVFVRSKDDILMSVDQVISTLAPKGVLWFAYPKKSSGIKTDISRDSGWAEYVVWLESAKKPETKQKRLLEAIEKLLSGKRNPSEK